MISRRLFFKLASAGALATCLSKISLAQNNLGTFIATPNPHHNHLSVAVARKYCERHARDKYLSDRCLDLTHFKTASMDALNLLASYDWWLADFGLMAITVEIAQAISRIPLVHTTFHHVESASPEAVASLASQPDTSLQFAEVASFDSVGIARLAVMLSTTPRSDLLTITGDFLLDSVVSEALVNMPIDIALTPLKKKLAVSAGAWQVFAHSPHKQIEMINIEGDCLPTYELRLDQRIPRSTAT